MDYVIKMDKIRFIYKLKINHNIRNIILAKYKILYIKTLIKLSYYKGHIDGIEYGKKIGENNGIKIGEKRGIDIGYQKAINERDKKNLYGPYILNDIKVRNNKIYNGYSKTNL